MKRQRVNRDFIDYIKSLLDKKISIFFNYNILSIDDLFFIENVFISIGCKALEGEVNSTFNYTNYTYYGVFPWDINVIPDIAGYASYELVEVLNKRCLILPDYVAKWGFLGKVPSINKKYRTISISKEGVLC